MNKYYTFGLGLITRLLLIASNGVLIWYLFTADSRIDQEKLTILTLIVLVTTVLIVVSNLSSFARNLNSSIEIEQKAIPKIKDGYLDRRSVRHPKKEVRGVTQEVSGNIKDGKLHGFVQEFNGGKLVAAGNMVQGIRHGVWKFYNARGNPLAKGVFNQGLQDGLWKINTEDLEDKLRFNGPDYMIQETYKDGVIVDGNWEAYHANGFIWQRGGYQNGLMHGLWEKYSFEHQEAVETRTMFNNGSVRWHHRFKVNSKGNGIRFQEFEWDYDWVGSVKIYDDFGFLQEEGPFRHGVKDGRWKVYSPVRKEIKYFNGYREWFKIKFLNLSIPFIFSDDAWNWKRIKTNDLYRPFNLDKYYSDDWHILEE